MGEIKNGEKCQGIQGNEDGASPGSPVKEGKKSTILQL